MNPSESSEIKVENLLALRGEKEAVRLITQRLRVQEMGPADHIRTKHEVKEFIGSGDAKLGAQLISRATKRRAAKVQAIEISESNGQRMVE